MILYINGCVRKESRTHRIATAVLQKLGGVYTEVNPFKEHIVPVDEETLNRRIALLEQGEFSHPDFRYARQFAEADTIVMSAPYWDFSFPAAIKAYIEAVCVAGIVFRYTEDGYPVGLCRAKKLYYVTTAGGPYLPDFSYNQIGALSAQYFGIPETELIVAENLDIDGVDADGIVNDIIREILA